MASARVTGVRHVNYTLKPATIDNAKPREKTYALTDGGGPRTDTCRTCHRRDTHGQSKTPDTPRDARLEARVSAAQKSLLQQAAALSGRTLSEFVVASAHDAARRVLAEHDSIRLSREEQLAFMKALLNPPEPNTRLKRAAKAYLRNIGQRIGT